MKDAVGDVQSILVLGGGSEIGEAIATRLASGRAASVVLAGRNQAVMAEARDRILAGGAGRVELLAFDASDPSGHDAVVENAAEIAGVDLDVVVLAFGVLGEQREDEAGGSGAVTVATTNYVGVVSSGLAAARRLRSQGHGTIVLLSSVAGERARRANFIYGSSKAGADAFAQGLADSLVGTGVRVLVVRCGFVRTKMTTGMPDAPLATTTDAVAAAVAGALVSGRETIWVPATLRPIFAAFRHLPRPVWRKLPL